MSKNKPSDPLETEKSTAQTAGKDQPDKRGASVPGEKRKYHIPEPKQASLSHEQELQKQKDRQRRKSLRGFRYQLRNSLFALAIIVIMVFLVFLMIRTSDDKPVVANDREGDAPKVATDFETVLVSEDPDRIMRVAESLSKNFMEAPLPVKIAILKDKLKLGNRLVGLDADETSYKFGINESLDALIMLDTMNLIYDLNEKECRLKLFELAGENLDIDDMNLRRKAHMAMCLAMTHDYTITKSDESFGKLMDQVKQSVNTLGDDVASASGLQKFAALVDLGENKDRSAEYRRVLGDIFKKNESAKIWAIGVQLHDDMLLGKINYAEFSQDILNDDQEALERLGRIVEVVSTSPLVGAVPYAKVVLLVEDLGQIGKVDLRDKYIEQLRNSIADVTHEQTRKKIEFAFQAYDVRNSLVGKTFDLNGKTLDGIELDPARFDNKIVAVLFFATNSTLSLNYVSQLEDLTYLRRDGVEFVLCCLDRTENSSKLQGLIQQSPDLIFTSRASAQNYVLQCPIGKVPFLILMNREQKIVQGNVSVDDLRTQIEAMIGL